MDSPFIGMIAMFGFNYAPRGWAFCNGQLISIAQNSALFSLLGTTYGGDGIQTFGLPNLQSRIPIGFGQGAGLSSYALGQMAGTENVTLNITQIPQHNHQMTASGDGPTQATAASASLASQARTGGTMPVIYANGATNIVPLASATSISGGNQPHSNIQPYLAINYSIALEGIYPSRN
ncbi:microcystin dependent MdpB family protein [Emticicia aquatilis]|uniref:Microcystin dependent MdpB family protein n=1 Tax=Emticicia aquatilis TaxID=1537369 RepID=A0A916ZAF4_9BACT|nr:tail fiber protein [Emticicia aquatilis]GGD83840.1 microcystin dependent MdpB family protein [Emticicia aquatilis]